jgi:hypothetical protein
MRQSEMARKVRQGDNGDRSVSFCRRDRDLFFSSSDFVELKSRLLYGLALAMRCISSTA